MPWSKSRSAVPFQYKTWRTKWASGVLAICAREGNAAKWQCDTWGKERGARMGVGGRVGAWGQPGVYPGLTACAEASCLAVVWFLSGGARNFCAHGLGGVVLRFGAGDLGRSGSTI